MMPLSEADLDSRPSGQVFTAGLLLLLILPIIITMQAQAEPYILEVKVGDAAFVWGQTDVRIPVYLKNMTDSVGAFDFLIFSDRPDLVSLKDTIISEGCLTEDWELMNSHFTTDTLINTIYLRLFGIADWVVILDEQAAIHFPQYGEIPLFYLLADINQESDSTIARASLSFLVDEPTDFIVSDQEGYTVGTQTIVFVDTVYYACETWYAGNCVSWVEVDGPPADSIEFWPYYQTWIDSTATNIQSGWIDVGWHLCGDFSGSDDKVNLGDITSMISFVYLDGSPPLILWSANVDGSPDGKVNLADITRLISHVYMNGGPLDCGAL